MPEVTEIVLAPDGLAQADNGFTVRIRTYSTSPPRLLIGTGRGDDEPREHWVGLGDTFPLDRQAWRFEDIHFAGAPNRFQATLRYVAPDAPPFTPPAAVGDRVWTPVTIHHPGPVGEAQIAQVEREFGQQLPPRYRQWLADCNGGIPAELCGIPGFDVQLDRFQPLLGLRPDEPVFDLRMGRFAGEGLFNRDYVVIANAAFGLIAVKVGGPGHPVDSIVGLSEARRAYRNAYQLAGYRTPEEYIGAELVTWLAPDINAFEQYLQPGPSYPPATLG